MTTVGAELSTLKTLHGTFLRTASETLDIKNSVDRDVNDAVWTGKNADSFRTAWQDYRKNLDNLNTALTDAASDVKNNHNAIAEATGMPDRI
jgi:uncharacterized protein YukE